MAGIGFELLVIVGLTLVNAFFSGAEIAILAVRKTRLRELAEEGHSAARTALRLRENPERFLATVQVGITVVGATTGAFGGSVLEAPIAESLRQAGLDVGAEKVAFAIVVALISFLSIVLGELVPKSLALRSSETVALWISRPLFFVSRVARPVIWFLTKASNVVLRPFRDQTTFTEARLSSEELQQLVEEAAITGSVDRETGEIASRAIDLGRLRAFSVMVPQNEIVWMPLDASKERALAILRERPHARYPVLRGASGIAGYVVAYEIYMQLLDARFDLAVLVRDVPTFPEDAAAVEILRVLQRARSEIGLIVDDAGSPSGLVSIEGLAEELFGEIVAENEDLEVSIVPQADGSLLVRGDTPLHELNRELELDLPIDANASTIAGLFLSEYGAFPAVGAKVVLPGGVYAEVKETSARRIHLIRIRPAK